MQFGDWLEALIQAFAQGKSIANADNPRLRCFGFATEETVHLVSMSTVHNQQEWFHTVEQRDRVLGKLRLEPGELMDLIRTPDGRADIFERAA